MTSKLLEYRGYYGTYDIDVESGIIFGKVEFINDLVTYEAATIPHLKDEFEAAVEDYLETCKLVGKDPDKAYSGTFNVRVGRELHKKLAIESKDRALNINSFLVKVCREYFTRKDRSEHFKSKLIKTVTKRKGEPITFDGPESQWTLLEMKDEQKQRATN